VEQERKKKNRVRISGVEYSSARLTRSWGGCRPDGEVTGENKNSQENKLLAWQLKTQEEDQEFLIQACCRQRRRSRELSVRFEPASGGQRHQLSHTDSFPRVRGLLSASWPA
jgi:hypothetical protein